jgi:hypothetical protein
MPSADDIETNIMTRLSNAAPADLVNDARIDADTQAALLRMFGGEQRDRLRALLLIAWVKLGAVSGVAGTDADMDASAFAFQSGGGSGTALVYSNQALTTQGGFDQQLASAIDAGKTRFGTDATSRLTAAAGPETPWLCTVICTLCAIALLDGVPFDEIPVCLVCVSQCSGSA